MIRSFCRRDRKFKEPIHFTFSDYAVASLIFDEALTNSLSKAGDAEIETRRWVETIAAENGVGVQVGDLIRAYSLTRSVAYERLRDAAKAGVIYRANPAERGNRKLYLPAGKNSFLPDPEKIFAQIAKPGQKVKFFHPVTGELVTYEK